MEFVDPDLGTGFKLDSSTFTPKDIKRLKKKDDDTNKNKNPRECRLKNGLYN